MLRRLVCSVSFCSKLHYRRRRCCCCAAAADDAVDDGAADDNVKPKEAETEPGQLQSQSQIRPSQRQSQSIANHKCK